MPQGAQQGKKYRDALLDAEVDRLARFYSDAEKEILRIINKALLKGDDLKYMQGMLQNVQAILGDLRAGSKTWCEEAVPHIYTEGIQFADAEIARYGGQVLSGFGAIHQQAAQVLAENTYNRYADVVDFIGRRSEDIYRNLALESVRGTVVGYETWQQVADNYRAKLAEEGITGFRDRANREWNMSTYAEMVARTTTMETHLQGTANRLLEQGHDLIEITSHVGACPLCVPWEGKVLSLTGKTPGYPTLEEAKAAGLFHVNCRHAYGISIDLDEKIKQLEDESEAEPEKPDPVEEVNALRSAIKTRGGGPTIGDARQAGRLVLEDLVKARAPLKAKLDAAKAKLDALDTPELAAEERRLIVLRNQAWGKMAGEADEEKYEAFRAEWQKIQQDLEALTKDRDTARTEYWAASRTYEGRQKENIDELVRTLERFRPVGTGGEDITGHLKKSRSPMRKIVREAYSYYPEDWVKGSVAAGKLTPKKVGRGYYDHYGEIIAISGDGGDSSIKAAIHELGHRFEKTVPGILRAEGEFYLRRTAGETPRWLGRGYAKSELTRRDKFVDKYMGKDYGGRSYELVSMGFEHAYTKPTAVWEDEEYAEWIYGLLLLH